MALNRLTTTLENNLNELVNSGRAKGAEKIITRIAPATDQHGPRYYLQGFDGKAFIRMNSNSYLGLALRPELIQAEEEGTKNFGVGPGAVRFISGTYQAHIDLEQALAAFHRRASAMLFSSAYVTSLGVIVPLTTHQTIIISDELNHNCIINAIRLARPADKMVYRHNDMNHLQELLASVVGKGTRVLVISDGIFSMRGDHVPLQELVAISKAFNDKFSEGVITIIDDSHGVGAFGDTGRGTEEYTGARADILIGTLGKAFGVNGGYVTSDATVIAYLRETAPMYIYSNPITVGEAYAAHQALRILDSPVGRDLLRQLRALTRRFREGLQAIGYETLPGEHPVVPLMVRDTAQTAELVSYLTENGILATGLNYPVVPKGSEEIRFQVCADHTPADIDYVLSVLEKYRHS